MRIGTNVGKTSCGSSSAHVHENASSSSGLAENSTNEDAAHDHIFMDLSFEIESNDDENAVESEKDESESALQIVPEVKKRNKFKWSIESTWDSLEDALMYLEEAGFVSYDYSDLKCGQKFYFRCKRIPKKRKTWCSKRYSIYLPSDNLNVLIMSNECEHNHDDLLKGVKCPPSDEMNEFLTDLFKCGTTKVPDVVRHIDFARTKHGLFATEETPDKRQIEYALRKYRDSQVPPMIKVGDLMDWCSNNSQKPSDLNEAFVIGSQSSSYEEERCYYFRS